MKETRFHFIDYLWFCAEDCKMNPYFIWGELCITHVIGTPGIALLAAIWSFVSLQLPDVLVFLFPALIYLAILVYSIQIYRIKGRGKQVKTHFLHSRYSNWYYELITCLLLIFLPLYAAIEIVNFFYE